MDELGSARADLFGYLMGAFIAVSLLGHHRDRFSSMVLGGIGEETAQSAATCTLIAASLRVDDRADIIDPLGRARRRYLDADPGNDREELASAAMEMWPDGHPLALGGDGLADVDIPVVIVNGADDHPYVDTVGEPGSGDLPVQSWSRSTASTITTSWAIQGSKQRYRSSSLASSAAVNRWRAAEIAPVALDPTSLVTSVHGSCPVHVLHRGVASRTQVDHAGIVGSIVVCIERRAGQALPARTNRSHPQESGCRRCRRVSTHVRVPHRYLLGSLQRTGALPCSASASAP
jgi:hypothetical protein